jgi:hypothetical protein
MSLSTGLLAQKKAKKAKKKNKFDYVNLFYSQEEIAKTEDRTERLFRTMTGHFSNKAQADTASSGVFAEQEIICIPIWQERKGEYWAYQCRFPAGQPKRLLAETFAKVRRRSRDTFDVALFTLAKDYEHDPLEWLKEKPFADLKPKDLVLGNCQTQIVELAPMEYEEDHKELCRYSYEANPNIQYVRRRIRLSLKRYNFLFSFYDAQQQVIFAYPPPDGLYFDRLNLKQGKYSLD